MVEGILHMGIYFLLSRGQEGQNVLLMVVLK